MRTRQPMLSAQSRHLRGLSIFCLLCFVLCGCGREGSKPTQASKVPESFHFMDIGANTVIDARVRDRLEKALGSHAVDRSATIDLELKYKGFLRQHYPELAALNQRINVNDVVRKEYPATKLTFRNTPEEKTVFDYVELTYDHASGCPLLIKMIVKEDIPELIKTVKDKYGQPQEIPLSGGKSWSLSWRKDKDWFVIARILGRYDRPEYHMMIVYTNRLERLLARSGSEESQRQREKRADDAFL
jgi:hypothetical protein